MTEVQQLPEVTIKRAYEAARGSDGSRVLVDGLWPRGLSRERLRLDLWCKEVAPSAELRRWFGHDPARWEAFRKRYTDELAGHRAEVDRLRQMAASGTLTLVYAAKDEEHNNAVVLKEIIESDALERQDASGKQRADGSAKEKSHDQSPD